MGESDGKSQSALELRIRQGHREENDVLENGMLKGGGKDIIVYKQVDSQFWRRTVDCHYFLCTALLYSLFVTGTAYAQLL